MAASVLNIGVIKRANASDALVMIYQHEGDSRCRALQTDTDIYIYIEKIYIYIYIGGSDVGQGEIGSGCPSRFSRRQTFGIVRIDHATLTGQRNR